MLAEIGLITTFLAFSTALITAGLALYSALNENKQAATSARNLLIAAFFLLTTACLVLIYAQWTGEYSMTYVHTVSSDTQPDTLKITALWGSQAGSLLFYSWLLSLFSVAAVLINWKLQRHLMSWVLVFTSGTLAFFLMLNVFYENPFERSWVNPDTFEVEFAKLQPDNMVVAYPWHNVAFNVNAPPLYSCIAERTVCYSPSKEIPIAAGWAYDGTGLNPLLRHPGMVIHPPMLYLGFTGFVIPFAFAMAALLMGQMDAGWIRSVRRWSLIPWMFLSIGLVLGGRWAYDVLGWGGYWGWDPVENSAFLPWITGTAFLHSVMIQEKRGMLKGWNMVMIITTYLLVLFGTVATRTGLLSSVHTFAQSPLAIPMFFFLSACILGSIAIFIWRGSQGYFKSDHEIEGILSRESMFMLNNWVFFALAIVVFWGTWAEKITDVMVGLGLRSTVINLGPEYYQLPTAILFLIIYVLMGIAPLVAWRRATAARLGNALQIPLALTTIVAVILLITGKDIGVVLGIGIISFAGFATLMELYKGAEARRRTHGEPYPVGIYKLVQRDRRRYGGYIIHLGVVVMGIGILASTLFQDVTQPTLSPGESVELGPYTMRYDQVSEARAIDDRSMVVADVTIFRDGKAIETLRPRRDFFSAGSPMSIAGVHSTIESDFYVLLTHWEGNAVTFRIYNNPLINFVWWGSYLLVIGTLIAAWPDNEPVRASVRHYSRQPLPVGAGD
jgi:cytochrome c-type biogenesis protein CcmF